MSNGLGAGKAEVWIQQAIFERDVNWMFSMDPKYVIIHKDEKHES